MRSEPDSPCLQINYSQDFALTISLSRAQEYSRVGLPGVAEYFYKVVLKISHPTGHFEYTADDICFDSQAFEHFAADLRALNAGNRDHAKLSEVGEMLTFNLERKGHHLHGAILVREYQPGNKELTVLTAGFELDYDLFVNKLAAESLEFSRELKKVKPDQA